MPFIRIHANGSENTSVLDAYVETTGCNKEYVWETDTMSEIDMFFALDESFIDL